MFLDPERTLTTCEADECIDCPAAEHVQCHFSAGDLARFMAIVLPGLVLGGVGLYQRGPVWFLAWLAFAAAFFSLIEVRVLCTHCPHYVEPSRILRCWANFGAPKLWSFRPGPMSLGEKAIFWAGLGAVWLAPAIGIALDQRWYLLATYLVAALGSLAALRAGFCSRCMNLACPLNGVSPRGRRAFLERNPWMAQAWGADKECG